VKGVKLEVHQASANEVGMDLVRISEQFRLTPDKKEIKSNSICTIYRSGCKTPIYGIVRGVTDLDYRRLKDKLGENCVSSAKWKTGELQEGNLVDRGVICLDYYLRCQLNINETTKELEFEIFQSRFFERHVYFNFRSTDRRNSLAMKLGLIGLLVGCSDALSDLLVLFAETTAHLVHYFGSAPPNTGIFRFVKDNGTLFGGTIIFFVFFMLYIMYQPLCRWRRQK